MEIDYLAELRAAILAHSVREAIDIALHELRVPLVQMRAVFDILQHNQACTIHQTAIQNLHQQISYMWEVLDQLLVLRLISDMPDIHMDKHRATRSARVQAIEKLAQIHGELRAHTAVLQEMTPVLDVCVRLVAIPRLQAVIAIATRALERWRAVLDPVFIQALRVRFQADGNNL